MLQLNVFEEELHKVKLECKDNNEKKIGGGRGGGLGRRRGGERRKCERID